MCITAKQEIVDNATSLKSVGQMVHIFEVMYGRILAFEAACWEACYFKSKYWITDKKAHIQQVKTELHSSYSMVNTTTYLTSSSKNNNNLKKKFTQKGTKKFKKKIHGHRKVG